MSVNPDDRVIQRHLDKDRDSPAEAIAAIVAELEDADMEEMTPVWKAIDHIVDHLFDTPPDPEARVEVEFNYEGYRVTVAQDGTVTFVEPVTSGR